MSSNIPYDPSLVLGNLIPRDKLQYVKQMAEEKAKVDSVEQYLDSLMRLKRTLDIHIQEMLGMGIDIKSLNEELNDVNEKIQQTSKEYSKQKIDSEKNIADIKKKMPIVNDSIESPLDFSLSKIETIPLGTNSMQMSTKYFSYNNVDNNKDNNGKDELMSEIISFMKNNTDMDKKVIEEHAHKQLKDSKHEHKGTLVICLNCTHQMANIYDKVVLDPNKAYNSWNSFYKDDQIDIDTLANDNNAKNDNSIEIISGATYGSSFIALIHVSTTNQINRTLNLKGALEKLNSPIFNDIVSEIKKLGIFDKSIQMNCNIISNGIVPNFKTMNDNKVADTVFDMSTMIGILDNYIKMINSGSSSEEKSAKAFGVPINFYTKKITKKEIIDSLIKDKPIIKNMEETREETKDTNKNKK